MLNAGRGDQGIGESTLVTDGLIIEHSDVSSLAWLQGSPVTKPQNGCRKGGHLVDSILKRHQSVLPHGLQKTGKGCNVARVRAGQALCILKREGGAITANGDMHVAHDGMDVLLGHGKIDGRHSSGTTRQNMGNSFGWGKSQANRELGDGFSVIFRRASVGGGD